MDNDKFYQELFGVLTRARPRHEQTIKGRISTTTTRKRKEMITICKKEYQDLLDNKCANVIKQEVRKSMAASYQTSGINPAQLIHNFITR